MKKIVLVFVFALSALALSAQGYTTGVGVRAGFLSGVSVKHFMSRPDALEGVVLMHNRGVMIAGLYQRHTNAFDAPGLFWYYGAGAHLGFYERRWSPWFDDDERGSFSTLGAMGVVGLEYKIEEIPVTIGVDITPAFNLIGHTGLWMGSSLTLRYTLN